MLTRQIAGILTRASSRGDEGEVTITTPDLDFMNDRIDPEMMDTASYLAGPASINYAHDHRDRLPVAKTLALDKSPRGIRARFQWRDDTFSREVKSAFDDGVLGASVEFIPTEAPVRNQSGGFDFGKTTLTGWAFTGNPANPKATKLLKSLRHALSENDLYLDVSDYSLRDNLFLQVDDYGHGAQLREEEKMSGKAFEPTFEVDLAVIDAMVKEALHKRVGTTEHHVSPASEFYYHNVRILEASARRSKMAMAKAYRDLAAKAEHDIRQTDALSLCPTLPLVR